MNEPSSAGESKVPEEASPAVAPADTHGSAPTSPLKTETVAVEETAPVPPIAPQEPSVSAVANPSPEKGPEGKGMPKEEEDQHPKPPALATNDSDLAPEGDEPKMPPLDADISPHFGAAGIPYASVDDDDAASGVAGVPAPLGSLPDNYVRPVPPHPGPPFSPEVIQMYEPPPDTKKAFLENPKHSYKEPWLSEALVKAVDALPKPDTENDSPMVLDQKFQDVFAAIHPGARPYYSIFQFWQFASRALEPWGYDVQLDTDQTYVHCYLKKEAYIVRPTSLNIFEAHFNYAKKTYQTSRIRPNCASNTVEKMAYYAQQRRAAEQAAAAAEAALKAATGPNSNSANRINSKIPISNSCLGSKTMFDIQWNSLFEKLKQYRETHGDCCVPTRGFEDPQLAKWVSRQREYYNKGSLSQERVDKLNELDFSWRLKDKDTGKGGASEETWMRHFDNLKKYKDEHGNTHVPTRGHNDYKLAKWVSRQRECFNKGVLSQHRVDKLNELDFSWRIQEKDVRKEARENYAETWMRHFETLKAYKEENGHTNVPTRNYKDPQLSKWVVTQREYYNKQTLSQDRIDRLNSLGFVWRLKDKKTSAGRSTVDCDATWKKHFENLKLYQQKHGNTHVPTRGYEDPQLAKWVVRQREYFNKNILSPERIELLNSINFTWRLKTKTVSGKKRSVDGSPTLPSLPMVPIASSPQASTEAATAAPTSSSSNKKTRTTRSATKAEAGGEDGTPPATVTALLADEDPSEEHESEAAALLANMRNPGTGNGRSKRKNLPTRGKK